MARLSVAAAAPELIERLAQHRTLSGAPRAELEWLAAHGSVDHFEAGRVFLRPGDKIETGMIVVLSGRLMHRMEHDGVWRKVIEWRAGDVTGMLPYSRLSIATGRSTVEEDSDVFVLPMEQVPRLPIECPTIAAALVHAMLDRARTFKSSDAQAEKMASLGKLAAGLAHELNNPASAAARSATLLSDALTRSDDASRSLGAARLNDEENAAVEALRSRCMDVVPTTVLTPLEHADREEAIADWLLAHGADDAFAGALADTAVTINALDELATTLSAEKLGAALRWAAAGCAIRSLVRDIDRAASRVHQLVSAVKGFTYMDRSTAPEPVDLRAGLSDTIAVLASKAKARSASLTIDVPVDLPKIRGFGGELNQVWMNLIDNALDASGENGRVVVSAALESGVVVVRVRDNGPGIPEELRQRIFDPFFTTKPVGQGTGLGLDIVRRLVERNDGLIDVKSEPGSTEFRVALPLVS